MASLRLIVGLGNPGPAYAATRHNIGVAFVRHIANRFGIGFKTATKVKGEAGRGLIGDADVRLLLPGCYMNQSGEAVAPYARYYRVAPEEMLVAYDEVAFEPGTVRLKTGGGANGHNGIKSIIEHLGSRDFHRLRIGVGHPGDKAQMVRYLTAVKMPAAERERAAAAFELDDELLIALAEGKLQTVMNQLHAASAADSQPSDASDRRTGALWLRKLVRLASSSRNQEP